MQVCQRMLVAVPEIVLVTVTHATLVTSCIFPCTSRIVLSQRFNLIIYFVIALYSENVKASFLGIFASLFANEGSLGDAFIDSSGGS